MSNKLNRQVVYENLQDEIKRVKELQEVEDFTSHEEYREPLSIDVIKEVKILLSWGGGEDGFKLRFVSGNELLGGVYYMADWGEYEEIELGDDEAQMIYDFYLSGDISGLLEVSNG